MKNVLVIGGSYFAGRVFVETLSKLNQFAVHVFNRGHLSIGIEGVRQLIGDRDKPDTISNGIPEKHWDVVVDFCAYTPEQVSRLLDRIPGTIGHYILISTTSIYAPTRRFPIAENAPKVNGPQPELGEFAEYGYLKWLAEQTCEETCRQKNLPFTVLRPAIIYGRYNYAPRESFFFDHLIANKPFAIPDITNIYYSFIWVEDLAEILVICLENANTYGEAFNVAGEERISYSLMADIIEEVCGRKFQRRIMDLDAIIRERIPMPFPPDEHLLYDGSKLRRVIGYESTPFILGMAKTWRNYQAVVQRRIEMQGGS